MRPAGGAGDAAAAERQCENIKSKKEPKKQCLNPATHGAYCGIHYKHPRPWCPPSPSRAAAAATSRGSRTLRIGPTEATALISKSLTQRVAAVTQIQQWWRIWRALHALRVQGPAVHIRSACVNDSDFFSTEALTDLSAVMFFSYAEPDKHLYGFDIRSIHTLLYRARQEGEKALNPYTRAEFPVGVSRQVAARVRWLTRRGFPTEWAPLTPPTPEQATRMKVVDLFSRIDELNYYSSPDWFIELTVAGQARFYRELYMIWGIRAGLTSVQKNAIVPQFHTRLFRVPPGAARGMTLDALQKLNMGVIRLMISAAADRNDRILGAMYVMTALTLVHSGARAAYPWLYESVAEAGAEEPPVGGVGGGGLFGVQVGWLTHILAAVGALEAAPAPAPAEDSDDEPPPLELPPAHDGDE